ncbi:KpsF/GutQ family sugar-phosphate isomerase [Candidatus Enterococcus willemsii]|uniref:Isomerase n=1 Tax=Candidatus Enterococcus willemsii TaxID=1857215 RepID=A0ABQ6Z1V3_9ENTE|nr:SIS domain-containing protein [Enterococcus sp. CU12B]KAF1305140.1 isomerase [Enterococcus sp. CU12B]
MDNLLKIVKQTIVNEQEALAVVQENLQSDMIEILEVIDQCRGKIVFSGVGKSGHIGKKLAATYSSLGIPAIFVHSTEAVHGDLGMIGSDDVVILLSNSGETSEVLATIPSIKKIGSTLIAFTSKKDSSLAFGCDYQLIYTYEKEADSLNLAPTTSAIIMLSIGDAIAVGISEHRHFTATDFALYHPGGSLGAQLKESQEE